MSDSNRQWVLHPVLVLPVLFPCAHNLEDVHWSTLIHPTAIVAILCILIVSGLGRSSTAHAHKIGLGLTVVFTLLLTFGHAHLALFGAESATGKYLVMVLYVALYVSAMVGLDRAKNLAEVSSLVTSVLGLLVAMTICTLGLGLYNVGLRPLEVETETISTVEPAEACRTSFTSSSTACRPTSSCVTYSTCKTSSGGQTSRRQGLCGKAKSQLQPNLSIAKEQGSRVSGAVRPPILPPQPHVLEQLHRVGCRPVENSPRWKGIKQNGHRNRHRQV